MTFGKTISQLRKKARLSQKELAARVFKEDGSSISPQYLNDIEHGRRNPPPLYILNQLAGILGIPVDHLFYLANQWPLDLRDQEYNPKGLDRAFEAFRSALKESGDD